MVPGFTDLISGHHSGDGHCTCTLSSSVKRDDPVLQEVVQPQEEWCILLCQVSRLAMPGCSFYLCLR
jgi:hypothetical protein